jgi:lysozyme
MPDTVMKNKTAIWLVVAALVIMASVAVSYKTILQKFLPTWEGFSATPYWDFRQWSWGYGTRVPGSTNISTMNPGGTITRAQALLFAIAYIEKDYTDLKKIITVPLSANQWAALLSFSYNLGVGNADNLAANINSNNYAALETQWKAYINAGGVPQQQLIDRRAAEWALWMKG